MTRSMILVGDVRDRLRQIADESVHCAMTSPPYFGLRDYGCAGQIGLEPSPAEYVAELVAVFREVRRVLRSDGTFWLNLGDSYSSPTKGSGGTNPKTSPKHAIKGRDNFQAFQVRRFDMGIAAKQRIMIPARVALALQADGWWLRDEIIWHKPNPMPVSVTDRTTPAHEMLYMFSKSARYHYDMEAIKEPAVCTKGTMRFSNRRAKGMAVDASGTENSTLGTSGTLRQPRSVWTIATRPFKGAHFATFPPDLVRPCIKAGCPEKCCSKCGAPQVREIERGETTGKGSNPGKNSHLTPQGYLREGKSRCGDSTTVTIGFEPSCNCAADIVGGTVLDPFSGAATTGLVAAELGRNYLGIELNPEYAAIAADRLGLRAMTPDNLILGRAA